MTRFPWHNQFPLDVNDVVRVLATELPRLPVRDVSVLGEGWDFTTFLVNGELVFRFPKRRICARALATEVRILQSLHAALPDTAVGMPRYAHFIERPAAFPLAFGAYGFLTGEACVETLPERSTVRTVASVLGDGLARIHATAPTRPPSRFYDQFAGFLPELREQLERMRTSFPAHLVREIHGLMATELPPYRGRPRFHHGDLGMEHVLLDGARLALLDWGDAGWGDPWGDFVGLWAWAGDDAVRQAVERYGAEPAAEDWLRLRYKGACVSVAQAYYGMFDERPGLYVAALRALERMSRAGQLDDPSAEDRRAASC